jgi:hypothetical protein
MPAPSALPIVPVSGNPVSKHEEAAPLIGGLDSEDRIPEEMEWLEALFGNYLDQNLIIRSDD